MSHEFRLRLPNGLEVQIAGDRDFVEGAYQDVKAGALRLFEREAGEAPPAVQSNPTPAAPLALEPPAPPAGPPARAKRQPRAKAAAGGRRGWTDEQREKFKASMAARRRAKQAAGGGNGSIGEARGRSGRDGGTHTLNPNVVGGGARVPRPFEKATPREIAAE